MKTQRPSPDLRQAGARSRHRKRYVDHRGYVPIQMAAGLDRVIRQTRLSFPDAYRLLLRRGAIIHIAPADDREPGG